MESLLPFSFSKKEKGEKKRGVTVRVRETEGRTGNEGGGGEKEYFWPIECTKEAVVLESNGLSA